MEWNYASITRPNVININALVSAQYMDLPKNYVFELEQHRCWELNFQDFGNIELFADGETYTLTKNSFILYAPMVEHGIPQCTKEITNCISISFESDSPLLYRFAQQVIPLPPKQQQQLGKILKLATFFSDRGLPSGRLSQNVISSELTLKEQVVLQLIITLLEEFFLKLLDTEENSSSLGRLPKLTAENRQLNLSQSVQLYIEQNLQHKLTLQNISQHFNVSVSKLCRDIKATTNQSLQELIADKRLTAAKRMIRQEEYSFSEIAERLGFSSLHYFSQWFKKQTNRSPTEYATSAKSRSEN